MKTTSIRARALACALLAGTAYCGLTAQPAAAQFVPPPALPLQDANGVDLRRGTLVQSAEDISVGSRSFPQRLSLVRSYNSSSSLVGPFGTSATHDFDMRAYRSTPAGQIKVEIVRGDATEEFTQASPGVYTSGEAGGATLSGSFSGASEFLTYTLRDGSQIKFSPTDSQNCNANGEKCGRATSWEFPSGARITFFYSPVVYLSGGLGGTLVSVPALSRLTNNFGYRLSFTNVKHSRLSLPVIASVTAENLAEPDSGPRTVVYGYDATDPKLSTITDTQGNTTTLSYSGDALTGITLPGAGSPVKSVAYAGGIVSSVTLAGSGTWTYAFDPAQTTVTDPLGHDTILYFGGDPQPQWVKDGLNRQTSLTWDANHRLKTQTMPEGNSIELTYDARGNATEIRAHSKPGSGLADIVTSASYPASCTNVKTCNQPTSITDARGNVTDYTYDGSHGGVLTVTLPPATSGAVRPQTRYGYTSLEAWYDNGSGLAASGAAVAMPTSASACRTLASCAGSADEVKATLSYGAAGAANNLDPVSVTAGAGDSSLAAITAFTHDPRGNLVTVDGPLAGTADTSRRRYDSERRQVGTISPDPDGAGPLEPRAVRIGYRPDGLVDKAERGNVAGQSNADWAAFSSLEQVETDYDGGLRPATQRVVAAGTTHALTQASYDALGRPECVAQRMNPAAFGSLPSSACTLGTQGTYGSDRIAKIVYDAAGQATQVKTAFGTADEANEIISTYRDNGQVATVTDAEGNKTTYEYDGLDRLAKTRFPDTTKGAGTSSTTDYEQPGYDANGNVTSFRNRAAETIGFGYDALDRVTSKNLPGTEPDATYAYDLLGNLLSATQNGIAIGFTYDALGRQLTQTIPIASISSPVFTSDYDLAGRRTRLTWPVDASSATAYFADYDYLVTGETAAVREKGATSGIGVLAAYGYDDRGRRTSLTRGNGTSTSYVYDDVSRLSQMAHDFGGTTHDLTLGFAYNPASQIVSHTRSNDLYAWTGHGNGTLVSSADGLNRLASHGGATPTYDARGNLTSDGTSAYAYTSENLLTSAANSGPLEYDPLMRFYRNYTTYFVHDSAGGGQLLGEYYNGNIAARYVPGAGMDEPLVAVTKTGARSWFHADERGSVIAGSNNSGVNERIVTYDENGKRGGNVSYRFAFTGQVHLINDVYDYKTRNYNARLPRFLQTDTIGYGGGMNLYVYGGGDPVNFTDPLGLKRQKPNIPPKHDSGGGGGGGQTVTITGDRADRALRDTLIILNRIATHEFVHSSAMGSNGETLTEDIVVTGRRPGRPGLFGNLPRPEPAILSSWSLPTGLYFAAERPQKQDRCGSKSTPWVPDRVGPVDLTTACSRHDDCYSTLGPSKAQCDARFALEVNMACLRSVFPGTLCPGLAAIYFVGVTVGGKPSFDEGQRQAQARRHP